METTVYEVKEEEEVKEEPLVRVILKVTSCARFFGCRKEIAMTDSLKAIFFLSFFFS